MVRSKLAGDVFGEVGALVLKTSCRRTRTEEGVRGDHGKQGRPDSTAIDRGRERRMDVAALDREE